VCLPLDPRFAGSYPAEDDGFLRAIHIWARLPSEEKWSRRLRVVRFYSMLKIPANMKEILRRQNYTDIPLQVSLLRYYVPLLVIARELWWMNQEWLDLRWGSAVDQKWSQCRGPLARPPGKSNNSSSNVINKLSSPDPLDRHGYLGTPWFTELIIVAWL
jgi:hypothetical protein